MWNDPIIESVRKIRRVIEKEGGDDFAAIFANAMALQQQYADRLVTLNTFEKDRTMQKKIDLKTQLMSATSHL